MLKKIITDLLKSKMHGRKYSSSRGKHKHYGHQSKYGHKYYKKKSKSSSFFGRSHSS